MVDLHERRPSTTRIRWRLEIRQNIANIGIFVMKQTVEIQTNPAPEKLKSLIDINCNLAAGLSGRA